MNVLVTGATTPLGTAAIEAMLASKQVDRVLAIGIEPVGWTDPRVAYRVVDLRHPRAVHDLLVGPAHALAIDVVVHAAHHRDARDFGRRVHQQNVEITRSLVAGCDGHPTIRHFVYRSFAEVYAQPHRTTTILDEDAPIDFDPALPQWTRDRVEADCLVAGHHAPSLRISILRFAEILAPDCGSQLWDYLGSRVCLRPLGFDPMINVLALADAARAVVATVTAKTGGVFNIRGADTLPLSRAVAESGRVGLSVPDRFMAPLYRLRRALAGFRFRYDLNARRFHFGGVLDGTRAARVLGYTPAHHVSWGRI